MMLDLDGTSQTLQFDSQLILGAAIFDLNGLPHDYFTTVDYQDIGWVQTAFQALGLRSLLTSSLQIETFQYSIVHGTEYCTLITKQTQGYIAMIVSHDIFQQCFEPCLSNHWRFVNIGFYSKSLYLPYKGIEWLYWLMEYKGRLPFRVFYLFHTPL